MNRGSEWRKWDLHIHTPASYSQTFKFLNLDERTKYNDDIFAKYIDELEKIQDIAVIGITDYFSIEGYKKISEYRQAGRLENFDLILPNIEFRLDKIITSRKDKESKRLNYHVIFSDEIEIEKIEKEFLEDLHIKTTTGEKRSLNKTNIEEIGRKLKEDHEKFRSESDYYIGCINITVSLDEIIEVLENKKSIFGGKYLLVLCQEGWDLGGWNGQDHLTRKELFVRSYAMFSSNPRTIDWSLGKKYDDPKDFIKEFGSLKPCIHGSDAHSFDTLCKPDENRFCWIKADPTFEGLRQIMYEPEERVRIQETCPEPRKSIYSLSSIKIVNSKISDELEIEEQEIPLNRNLITVIGGKGSGKTALLDLIANCFEDRCKRNGIDKNSFIQRIEDQKPDLEFETTFISKETFSKKLVDDILFPHSRITYLPQRKIEEYSGDKTKLHEKIKEIIFNNKEVTETGYIVEFEDISNKLEHFEKNIKNINSQIYTYEEETKSQIEKEFEYEKKIKEGELKNKQEELKDLIKLIGEESIGEVEELKEEERKLRDILNKQKASEDDLLNLKNNIESASNLNSEIGELNYKFTELELSIELPKLNFEPLIVAIENAETLINDEIEKTKIEIETKTAILDKMSGINKEHANLLGEIEKILGEIKLLDYQLEQINEKKKLIGELENERKEKYIEFVNKYFELKNIYEGIIETFSSGKDEILSNIDFQSNLLFNKELFNNSSEDIFDFRKINIEEIDIIINKLDELLDNPSQTNIDLFIDSSLEYGQYLKRSNLDFYNLIFRNYFSLNTEILFNGIHIDKLSIGQKGTILLKILLAEGDHPLIIDQPEENLDNKFVYEFLKDAFREAKNKRQIIIATHNANLVVNTDAEQVIIANFKNNKISYQCGSIENLNIRKDLTTLLEGGPEAFRKREMKYGIESYE